MSNPPRNTGEGGRVKDPDLSKGRMLRGWALSLASRRTMVELEWQLGPRPASSHPWSGSEVRCNPTWHSLQSAASSMLGLKQVLLASGWRPAPPCTCGSTSWRHVGENAHSRKRTRVHMHSKTHGRGHAQGEGGCGGERDKGVGERASS